MADEAVDAEDAGFFSWTGFQAAARRRAAVTLGEGAGIEALAGDLEFEDGQRLCRRRRRRRCARRRRTASRASRSCAIVRCEVRSSRAGLSADLREGARIGWRDAAHEVVDLGGRAGPVDRAVLGTAAAEIGARREIERVCAARCRRRSRRPGGRATISAATVTLSKTSRAVSSGRIGTAIWSTRSPASGLIAMWCSDRAGFALAADDGPVHRHAAAVLRQQRPVHVEGAAGGDPEQLARRACGGSRRRTGTRAPPRAPGRSTSAVFGSSGVITGIPLRPASAATLSNQMSSAGLSRCVTTSRTSTPCASSTERQRQPTL